MIENGKYVIVRTYSAGVFAGTLVSRNGKEVTLKDVHLQRESDADGTAIRLINATKVLCRYP